jgi:predicted component of type VI protein secretion system
MRIGRAAEQCNIVLDLPSVSRVHCTVQYHDKQRAFYLTDLSTNGTLVGEERIPKGGTRALAPGDCFCITDKETIFKVGLE